MSPVMIDDSIEMDLQDVAGRRAGDSEDVGRLTDGQLAAAVVSGNERAFEEIFNRYLRLVASNVGRFFRDKNDIEEFIQQSFTKVYLSLNKFKGNENNSLAAWITRISINVCYDEFRRRHRTGDGIPPSFSEDESDHLGMMIDDRSISAEDAVIRAQLADKVLSSLSPKDRIAVSMVYSEDLTIEEAADILGISSSSLKSRLFRCRNQLKTRFGYLFR